MSTHTETGAETARDVRAAVDSFLALVDREGRPTNKPFAWGGYPVDDPDVQKYERRMAQADDFLRWNAARPLPTVRDNFRTSIAEDLNAAVLKAPDISMEHKEDLLAGGYMALATTAPQFKEIQKAHKRFQIRRAASLQETEAALREQEATIKSLVEQVIAEEGHGPQSTLISSLRWALADNSERGIVAEVGKKIVQAVLAHSAAAAAVLVFGAMALVGYGAYKLLEENYNRPPSEQERELMEEIRRQNHKNPNKARRRSKQSRRLQSEIGVYKSLTERERYLMEERVIDETMGRTFEIASGHHSVSAAVVVPAPDEREIFVKAAAARRKALDLSTRSDERDDSFYDVVMNGTPEQIRDYVAGVAELADRPRQAASAGLSGRLVSLVGGYARGDIADVLEQADDLWM